MWAVNMEPQEKINRLPDVKLKKVPVSVTLTLKSCQFVPKHAYEIYYKEQLIGYLRGRPWIGLDLQGNYLEMGHPTNKEDGANMMVRLFVAAS